MSLLLMLRHREVAPDSGGVVPHVCFSYGGVTFWSFGVSAFFSYDETTGWTYEGEC